MTTLLVLGIGNPTLGDDAAGPRAVAALSEARGLPPGTKLLDGGVGGPRLLPEIADAHRLIVIDGVDLGWRPGEVRRVAATGVPLVLGRPLSPHEVGLRELLALCGQGGTGPAEVSVWSVQVASLEPGARLSPAVQAALPWILAGVRAEAWRMSDTADQGTEP